MAKIVLFNIIRFLVLILIQVAVLKNIGYYNLAVAFPYILIVLLLPIGIPNTLLYLLAFLTGLSIDAFYDSIGIQSFNTPSWGNMGFKWYLTYISLSILIHHVILFFVEAFSFHNFIQTVLSIAFSSIFTLVLIFVISLLTYHKKSRVIN
jgi:hypothetical protein